MRREPCPNCNSTGWVEAPKIAPEPVTRYTRWYPERRERWAACRRCKTTGQRVVFEVGDRAARWGIGFPPEMTALGTITRAWVDTMRGLELDFADLDTGPGKLKFVCFESWDFAHESELMNASLGFERSIIARLRERKERPA